MVDLHPIQNEHRILPLIYTQWFQALEQLPIPFVNISNSVQSKEKKGDVHQKEALLDRSIHL